MEKIDYCKLLSGPGATLAMSLAKSVSGCPTEEKKEGFSSNQGGGGGAYVVMWMINLFITFISFTLAFRCIAKGGSAFGHIMGACCCGILYIAYALSIGC